jgi:predicted RNA-binding protein YlqC (UPF0109 family)
MGEVQDRDADDGELDDVLNEDEVEDDGEESSPAPLPRLDPSALAGVLEFLAKGLVDAPDKVRVESVEREGTVTLRLSVDQPDMGKIIGRSGRTARALRTLLRAAGVRAGVGTHVEIVEQTAGGSGG